MVQSGWVHGPWGENILDESFDSTKILMLSRVKDEFIQSIFSMIGTNTDWGNYPASKIKTRYNHSNVRNNYSFEPILIL